MAIIDRRLNERNKSLTNRNKYLDRIKDQIKESVRKAIRSNNVKDLISPKDKNITIPGKGLAKPSFNYKKGGVTDHVLPGNKKFEQGQRIRRPEEGDGDGGGRGGSVDGEGEDPFTFSITKEEFLNIFFEDMELPDMIKKQAVQVEEAKPRRAGYSTTGASNRLNILRSMKEAKGRKVAITAPIKKELEKLEKELAILTEDDPRRVVVTDQIKVLEKRLAAIPFLDETDLRYNRWENKPQPVTQAVMFSIMDVSGSMGEWEKEMAKRFFVLLALFLQHNYERVDMIWIRHTSDAKEVSEDEFFHAKDTGGTVISSALKLMKDIINERYPQSQWNIFVSQISDGDNFSSDEETTVQLLDELIPKTQYYTYIEINKGYEGNHVTSVMECFAPMEEKYEHAKSSIIRDVADIYPVFRQLFEKKA